MKFTLKDYQEDAVVAVLDSLARAKGIVDAEGKEVSVSLSATTGAGKTVMAAAVIETLFYGNDGFDFEPDPGAVVVWFSDDPNLNDQTRFRLMEASDKLLATDLVVIEPPFAKPRLDPGKVYFLNTQKLSKNSLLVRGHNDGLVEENGYVAERLDAMPDMQGWTIWETIGNTIANDDLTLYLIIDEAHRGFNTKSSRDKSTIVSRLVNGHAGYPAVPIVWGISATIERFKEAMDEADASADRRALPPVTVPGFMVQESGLIKDTVVLDIPAEAGNFDSVLVRRAAKKLRASTDRWAEYAKTQGSADVVQPLLVLQAPNTPDPDQLGRALDEVFEEFKDLGEMNVRHVFGDHTTQRFGAWQVDWIEPQRVEETSSVRVLLAKDAISTGWDCPRAEVLVSFRPAQDHTHITQLLGRMVRSPLARRIPGDDQLNAVECILPFFDRTTAGKVVKLLTGQIDEVATGTQRVIVDECVLGVNQSVLEAVWRAYDSLPSKTIPKRGASPVKRLVLLALELAADGLHPGALEDAETEMHRVLDAARARYPKLLENAVDEIWSVRGQTIVGRQGGKQLTYSDFVEYADDRAIQVGFTDAKKAFGSDIAQSYVNYLTADDDDDDNLRDAYVTASALAIIPEVRSTIDREADELASRWFAQYRVAIRSLPDDRQQAYADVQVLATEPQRSDLTRPRNRIEDYVEMDGDQQQIAPLMQLHLMSDEHGQCPVGALNKWERQVVSKELTRSDVRGWYRNPPRPAVDSIGVPYRDETGNWRSMHPDFVFFNEVQGRVVPSIVDPHGLHLEDSDVKLRGLVDFAEEFAGDYHRIEAITELNGKLFALDLKAEDVRAAVRTNSGPVKDLYERVGVEY